MDGKMNQIQEHIATVHREDCSANQETAMEAMRLALGSVVSMTLRSAILLGAIDVIYDNGSGVYLSPSDIYQRLPRRGGNTRGPVLLGRLLRLLASFSVLKYRYVDKHITYAAGPVCRYFAMNESRGSMGPLLLFTHEKYSIESWYHLSETIVEGGTAFSRAHGMSPTEYYQENEMIGTRFNEAMASHTILIMKMLLDVYDGFDDLNVLVDVGGGIGIALGLITAKHPRIRGINYDLPHVISGAPSYSGVEHVAGDMFVSIPRADAVFMKWMLHVWNDEYAVKLLRKCREALHDGGKVICLGTVLEEDPVESVSMTVPEMDLTLMVRFAGGQERTLKQLEDLALLSGFSGCRLCCTVLDCRVVEFYTT